jgi:CheY-like chemotaxis protein
MWRILVVDDEERVALSLQEGLETLPNCEIAVATNGEQALRYFEEWPFDLLITDYRMPRMSGMALAARVRRRYPETAIIMLTAHDSHVLREQAARLSILGVLEKPVGLMKVRDASLEALEDRNGPGAHGN